MSIKLDKILNVSAESYCKSVGKELKDFELVGVSIFNDDPSEFVPPKKEFAKKVPKNAEVVTNYKVELTNSTNVYGGFTKRRYLSYEANGTALVAKK